MNCHLNASIQCVLYKLEVKLWIVLCMCVTASTKCCSRNSLRRITSGITGLLKVTESKF